jgi:hypothetical protein
MRMILLSLLVAASPLEAAAALNQWHLCVRANADAYAQLQLDGQPQESVRAFVEAHCWKARATAALALEPVAKRALVAKGINSPTTDVIGLLIMRMLNSERDKALQGG